MKEMKNEMRSNGKAKDEPLQQIENRMKETENKVWNNDNQLIDRSKIFGGSNIYYSIAITPDVNKFNKNDISRMI